MFFFFFLPLDHILKMVADKIETGVAIAAADQTTVESGVATKDQLPNGDYILVSVDIDTTGRRLIDEVCMVERGQRLMTSMYRSCLTQLSTFQ